MLPNKRLEMITKLLRSEGMVDINYLTKYLGVSDKTIRLDLNKLEKAGVLKRVHGGAVLNQEKEDFYEPPLKIEKYNEAKHLIAKCANLLVEEGDVIFLDDGDTCLHFARVLGNKKITVLTNDILIIGELIRKPNITLYIVGGRLYRDGDSFLVGGEDAVAFIQKYRFNKAFLSTSTIDINEGLMIFYYGDSLIKRACINNADKIICLADSSKFGKKAFTKYASIDEIDSIITDEGLVEEEREKYRNLGVEVIIA